MLLLHVFVHFLYFIHHTDAVLDRHLQVKDHHRYGSAVDLRVRVPCNGSTHCLNSQVNRFLTVDREGATRDNTLLREQHLNSFDVDCLVIGHDDLLDCARLVFF